MAFITNDSTQVGTKGSDVYTAAGVNDPRVALSALLNRGAELKTILDGLKSILTMKTEGNQHIEDAFVLAFQTRDVRGGKGERDLFTKMMKSLCQQKRQLVQTVIFI